MRLLGLITAFCILLSPPLYGQSIKENFNRAVALAEQGEAEASLKAMRQAASELWLTLPLTIANGTFVNAKASGYGAFSKRDSSTFKAGDTLLVYAEPIGYGWDRVNNTEVIKISVDAVLLNDQGTVIWDREEFGDFNFATVHRNMAFFLNLSLDVTGLGPGNYALEYTVNDKVRQNSTKLRLPFTLQ